MDNVIKPTKEGEQMRCWRCRSNNFWEHEERTYRLFKMAVAGRLSLGSKKSGRKVFSTI